MAVPELDPRLRHGLRAHYRRFHDVTDLQLAPAAFRSVQLHRNLAHYAFLMNVCRLVQQSFLPDPETGKQRFHPFTADEQQMGRLFESFVHNFLKLEQDNLHVSAPRVPWRSAPIGEADQRWLPQMQADVMLSAPGCRAVVEVKYTKQPLQTRYGTAKLRSDHLYQLLTYLTHLRATPGPPPAGVLLYAGLAEEMKLDYWIDGHPLLVRSLNLAQDWPGIHDALVDLATEVAQRLPTSGTPGSGPVLGLPPVGTADPT